MLRTAHGQEPPAPRIVRVEVDDVVGDIESLRASLRELLLRVNVRLVEIDVPDDQLLALVVITGSVRGANVRVFPAHAREPATSHHVPGAESEALFRETLAHVVLGAIEPLLSAPPQPPPAPPAPPQENEEEEEETPSPPLPLSYELGGALGPLRIGTEQWTAQLSALVNLHVGTRLPSLFGLELGGALPSEQRAARVSSTLWLLSARARAGVEPLVRGRVRLGVVLSAGADFVSVSAKTERPTERIHSPRRQLDPVLGVASELRVALPHQLSMLLALGCDWNMTPHQLLVREREQDDTLWRTSALRPRITLGLLWSTP